MNTARTIAPTLGVWSAYMIAVLVGVHFLTHPFTFVALLILGSVLGLFTLWVIRRLWR